MVVFAGLPISPEHVVPVSTRWHDGEVSDEQFRNVLREDAARGEVHLAEVGLDAFARTAWPLRHGDRLRAGHMEVRRRDRARAVRVPVIDGDFALCNIENAVVVANSTGLKSPAPFNLWQRFDDVALKKTKTQFSSTTMRGQAQNIRLGPAYSEEGHLMRPTK